MMAIPCNKDAPVMRRSVLTTAFQAIQDLLPNHAPCLREGK